MVTTTKTYMWSSVTQIYPNGQQTRDNIRKTVEGITSNFPLKAAIQNSGITDQM